MPLDLVKLMALMERTTGRPEIIIGLIDGPVAMNHPDLVSEHIRGVSGSLSGMCTQSDNVACAHGTFVAGILAARRSSLAPAICPNCTLLVRPLFVEALAVNGQIPGATPQDLARAIVECLAAGARVLNLSVALTPSSTNHEHELEEALNYAARRGVIVVAAAGNDGALGSSTLTRHPWVIPVVAYDLQGQPLDHSNLGNSIGRRGLGAPGVGITSLSAAGKPLTLSGTSAAAPFVTGAIALLWSEFPEATVAEIKFAITQTHSPRPATVVPPLLDAWRAYQIMRR